MTRQRDRRVISKSDARWKVYDDRSGFIIYSDKAVRDSKGVLTNRQNYDPLPPCQMDEKLKYTTRALPFVRAEAVTYVGNDPDTQIASRYWENQDMTWEEWTTNWEDS